LALRILGYFGVDICNLGGFVRTYAI